MVIRPTGQRLLLGSNSPRRRELMGMLADDFSVAVPHDVDESYPADMPAVDVPVFLSSMKAYSYLDELKENEILITADTVVIHGDRILGKPHDEEEARRMLRLLSDSPHKVVTGVTLTDIRHRQSFATMTEVLFDRLDDSEIEAYIRECRPMDKAGAYGIQEWIGAIGIKAINGCYYNVMGLPVHDLYHALKTF